MKDAGNNCCSHSGRTDTEDILFNPNVFTDFKLAGSEEVIFFACDYCSLLSF